MYSIVRKKFFLCVLYLIVIVGFISISYKTTDQNHVSIFIQSSIYKRTYSTLNVSFYHENTCEPSRRIAWNVIHRDELFNYVGFVLRSHSLFYCSVPKVATRTLLLFLTYLHIRDDLIPLFSNNSRSDILSNSYFNPMILSSIKNDSRPMTNNSISLLQLYLSQLLFFNSSKIDVWSIYQNKTFPFIRLRTLSDPSIVFSSNFLRVIFVRHPLERLASAYVDKITSLNNKPFSLYDNIRRTICRKYSSFYLTNDQQISYRIHKDLAKQINEPCEIIPKFEHFIEYLMSNSHDVHWKPYSSLCHVCLFKYNFIGKFETIEEDLERLIKYLGLKSNDWIKGNYFNNKKTKENYKLMYSNLNQRLICYLKFLYKYDFKLFNYQIDDYLTQNTTIQCSSRYFRKKF